MVFLGWLRNMQCRHEHTGSCSPEGIYLYVACMDCGQILAESEEGERRREKCPGFKPERRGGGICKYCHHDAEFHISVLMARPMGEGNA